MDIAGAEAKAPKSLVVAEGPQEDKSAPDIRFVHFNDVYHIEPGSRDPVGGVARFQSLHSHYRKSPEFSDQVELLTFFSGDAFNPSLESTVTKGKLFQVCYIQRKCLSSQVGTWFPSSTISLYPLLVSG